MSTNEAAERLRLHFKSHDGPCQYCRAVASVDVRDALAHEASAGAAPLDVQADDLLKACYERNIHSRGDMEYAFQPWALDVEQLAMAIYGDRWYEPEMYRSAAKYAAEYARLRRPSIRTENDHD